jgi:hypothetical protein
VTRATRTPPGQGSVVPVARLVVLAPGDSRIESPADRGGVTIGSAALSGVDTPDAVRAVTPTRTQEPEEVADLVRD